MTSQGRNIVAEFAEVKNGRFGGHVALTICRDTIGYYLLVNGVPHVAPDYTVIHFTSLNEVADMCATLIKWFKGEVS